MRGEPRVEPLQIDVGSLVRLSVATLYSHLVTRPTGRAVRLAIEAQLAEAGETSCSLIDLSQVTVLDFSCADEVVAKLLARYLGEDRPQNAFFVFRGVGEPHREPVEAVLERQRLAAVTEGASGYELLGSRSGVEARVWATVEAQGRIPPSGTDCVLPLAGERDVLDELVRRRLVFRAPGGDVYALSRLVRELPR